MKTLIIVTPQSYKEITESRYQKAVRLLVTQLGTINLANNDNLSERHTAIYYDCTFSSKVQKKVNEEMSELNFIALFVEFTDEDESNCENYSLCLKESKQFEN